MGKKATKKPRGKATTGKSKMKPPSKQQKKKKVRKNNTDSSSSSSETERSKSNLSSAVAAPIVLPTAKERPPMPGYIYNVAQPDNYLVNVVADERPDLVFEPKLSATEADCLDKHLKEHAELAVGDVIQLEDKETDITYEIRSKYNEGRYSALYICTRTAYKNNKLIEDKGMYMMKTLLRKNSQRCPLLIKRESKVLQELKKNRKIISSTIVDSGKVCDMPYLVMNLLDRNIEKFRADAGGFVSMTTAVFIAMEALNALTELHNKKFVHRDVKPANLAFGLKADAMRVFLIDYGDTVKAGKSIRMGVPDGLTLPYWSVDCHKKAKVSFKTDLEAWFYTLIDLAQPAGLPWKKNTNPDAVNKAKDQFWKEFASQLSEPNFVSVGEKIAALDGTTTAQHAKIHKLLGDVMQSQLNGTRFVPDWKKK